MTWNDTKRKGLSQAMTWDDTKRRKVLGALMTLAMAALMVQAPIGPKPVAASPSGQRVSVIVQTTAGGAVAAQKAIASLGGQVTTDLGFINSVAAQLPASAIASLRNVPGIVSVVGDSRLTPTGLAAAYDDVADPTSMKNTVTQIGARSLYARGITGKGVGIALIDTGVAPVAGLDGKDQVVNGADLSFDRLHGAPVGLDSYGHGTHLAGIIAGHDAGADVKHAKAGEFVGIAPDSRIVNVKVGDATGKVDVSQVIAGIGWVIRHRTDSKLNIRVINLSYGTDSVQDYTVDPLARAAEAAWQAGIVVVAAAGNDGTGTGHLANPASDPFVIAVGAHDVTTGAISSFSTRGDGVRNPDLVAPGAHIQSLRVPGSYIDTAVNSGKIGGRFQRGSGTSQATAVTSGAVALMLQESPGLTPDQVKAALMGSAEPLGTVDPQAEGHGMLKVAAALRILDKLGDTVQHFASSLGTGSLEAARGTQHVAKDGHELDGENTFDGGTWTGGTWTGGTWTGGTWTGGTWTGGTWTGGTWTGGTWTGGTWTGGTWTGGTWTGGTWTGGTWTGGTWTGGTWTGGTWTGGSWD